MTAKAIPFYSIENSCVVQQSPFLETDTKTSIKKYLPQARKSFQKRTVYMDKTRRLCL